MNARSSRRLSAAMLCILGAGVVSLPAMAGEGCPQKAMADVEGGNGQMSASEHAAGAQKRFDSMDADHDGKITAAEIASSQGAERIAWARKPVSSTDKIRKLDSNKDGVLTASEYANGSQAIFNELDSDSDGYLRASEMQLN